MQDDVTVRYDSHYVFTRIRYGANLARGFFGGADGWAHDYPTADRNLVAILDYITNMRVRMDGSNILDLDDPEISENPIIYMSEPGFWTTTEEEAKSLRAYLLKGGLIIFDDFEGDRDWRNLVAQMRRALPGPPVPADRRHASDLPFVLRHQGAQRSTPRWSTFPRGTSRCSRTMTSRAA